METMTCDLTCTYPITPAQIAQYQKEGHILLRGVASPEEVAFYRPLITGLLTEAACNRTKQVQLEDLSTLYMEVSNVWRRSPELREFVFARKFARIAAALMGVRRVRLYHDQALVKDPGGSRTPWHKDHYSWPLATHHTIKMWMALCDVTPDMGSVAFAVGSHHGAMFPEVPFSINLQEIFGRVIKEHKIPTPTYTMSAGDVTFHSGDTLHSAGENRSQSRREALSIIYYADGTRVMVPDHEHRRADLREFLPGLKPGDLAASELNPLLYDASEPDV